MAFSIGVTRNNAENRLHTNNTQFSFFSYLIIGTTNSKDNGGYEPFQTTNKSTAAAEFNNKITHTRRVLLLHAPGQPTATSNKQAP